MTEALSEEDVEFVPATADTASVEAAAAMLTGVGESPEAPSAGSGPILPAPEDGPVVLPGGFRRLVPGSSPPQFKADRKVWISELDGYAEEHIAKARLKDDLTEFLQAILEAGVDKIGDEQATISDLRELLAGDREYLLLQISIATYGNEIHYPLISCDGCGDTFEATITKDEIPVVSLENPDEPWFTFTTSKGRELTVHYPTSSEQAKAFDGTTGAEADTLLLAQVVDEFHGDTDEARRMRLVDRKDLLRQLAEKGPGPRYNGVKFPHEPGCGAEVRLAVGLPDLFPGL